MDRVRDIKGCLEGFPGRLGAPFRTKWEFKMCWKPRRVRTWFVKFVVAALGLDTVSNTWYGLKLGCVCRKVGVPMILPLNYSGYKFPSGGCNHLFHSRHHASRILS